MPLYPLATPQMMGELHPGWFVFVSPTTQLLAYLQREMTVLSIGWIPRSGIAGSRSVNIFNFNKSCQITSQKGCSNSQLQAVCERLSPHIPTRSQHWLLSILHFCQSERVGGNRM